jgi:hypothetical protein
VVNLAGIAILIELIHPDWSFIQYIVKVMIDQILFILICSNPMVELSYQEDMRLKFRIQFTVQSYPAGQKRNLRLGSGLEMRPKTLIRPEMGHADIAGHLIMRSLIQAVY